VCLAVAVYEGEYAGAFFGAVGGLLWDYAAGRVAGLLALGLMAVCFAAAILVQLYLRTNAMNFILVSGCACLLITGVDFLFYYARLCGRRAAVFWRGAAHDRVYRGPFAPGAGGGARGVAPHEPGGLSPWIKKVCSAAWAA